MAASSVMFTGELSGVADFSGENRVQKPDLRVDSSLQSKIKERFCGVLSEMVRREVSGQSVQYGDVVKKAQAQLGTNEAKSLLFDVKRQRDAGFYKKYLGLRRLPQRAGVSYELFGKSSQIDLSTLLEHVCKFKDGPPTAEGVRDKVLHVAYLQHSAVNSAQIDYHTMFHAALLFSEMHRYPDVGLIPRGNGGALLGLTLNAGLDRLAVHSEQAWQEFDGFVKLACDRTKYHILCNLSEECIVRFATEFPATFAELVMGAVSMVCDSPTILENILLPGREAVCDTRKRLEAKFSTLSTATLIRVFSGLPLNVSGAFTDRIVDSPGLMLTAKMGVGHRCASRFVTFQEVCRKSSLLNDRMRYANSIADRVDSVLVESSRLGTDKASILLHSMRQLTLGERVSGGEVFNHKISNVADNSRCIAVTASIIAGDMGQNNFVHKDISRGFRELAGVITPSTENRIRREVARSCSMISSPSTGSGASRVSLGLKDAAPLRKVLSAPSDVAMVNNYVASRGARTELDKPAMPMAKAGSVGPDLSEDRPPDRGWGSPVALKGFSRLAGADVSHCNSSVGDNSSVLGGGFVASVSSRGTAGVDASKLEPDYLMNLIKNDRGSSGTNIGGL